MKIFFRVLAFLLTMPVIELALLLQVAEWAGFWITVAIIAATAVAGSYLAKREGLSAWNRLQGRLGEGGLPGDEILDAVIILVAGALLITPGVLTDLTGFIGLFPLTRGWVRRLVKRRLKKAMREGRLQTSFGTFGGAAEPFGEAGGPADASGPAVGGSPAERGPSPRQEAPSQQGNGAAPADPADQKKDTPPSWSRASGTQEDAGPSSH